MSRADTIAHAKQLRETGLPLKQIAERMGLSLAGVRGLLRDAGMTGAPRMGVWTDARIALLTKLWNEGKSGGEIALRLACGVSRNAVLGKADRLGLLQSRAEPSAPSLRAPPVKRGPANPVGRRPHPKTAGIKPMSWGSAVPIPNPEDRPAPIRERADTWQPLPGVVPVSILDLRPLSCRWPVEIEGSDEHHFCGAMAISTGLAGARYCPTHSARSRSKSQPAPSAAEPFRRTRRAA